VRQIPHASQLRALPCRLRKRQSRMARVCAETQSNGSPAGVRKGNVEFQGKLGRNLVFPFCPICATADVASAVRVGERRTTVKFTLHDGRSLDLLGSVCVRAASRARISGVGVLTPQSALRTRLDAFPARCLPTYCRAVGTCSAHRSGARCAGGFLRLGDRGYRAGETRARRIPFSGWAGSACGSLLDLAPRWPQEPVRRRSGSPAHDPIQPAERTATCRGSSLRRRSVCLSDASRRCTGRSLAHRGRLPRAPRCPFGWASEGGPPPQPNRSVPCTGASGARRPRRRRLPARARHSDLWARHRRSKLATGRRSSRSGAISHPQGPSDDGRGIPVPDRHGSVGSRFPGRAAHESHFP